MGKGDQRTKRGKINKKSYGKTRLRKKKKLNKAKKSKSQ
ncbi:30S ribosomal protein THX [Myxococcota bacterium]